MRRGIRFWTIIGALAAGAAMAPATVNAQSGGTRHVAIGYDHIPNVQGGRPTGFAVIGEQETVVKHVTIVVGTSFHRISDTGRYGGTVGTASASQLFAGAGPGFRYQAAEKIAVVGHALIGYTKLNGTAALGSVTLLDTNEGKVQARFGGGFEYQFSEGMAARATIERDTDTHMTVGMSFGF